MPTSKGSDIAKFINSRVFLNLKFGRRVQPPLPNSKTPLEYELGNATLMVAHVAPLVDAPSPGLDDLHHHHKGLSLIL